MACIFDMDGVLFNSNIIHKYAFEKTLKEESIDFNYASISGMSTEDAIHKIFKDNNRKITNHKKTILVENKKKIAHMMLKNNPPVADNCLKIISYLSSKNIKLGLASSSSKFNVDLFLEASGIAKYLSVVLSSIDVNNTKPNPEIYFTAINKLKIDAKYCYIFEDSANGLQAAIKTKANIIGVVGELNELTLKKLGAYATIKNLSDILEITELFEQYE